MGGNQLVQNNYLPTWNASCETSDCWDSRCRDRSRLSCIRGLLPVCRLVASGPCTCCCPRPPASLPRPRSSCPVLISRYYCSSVSATPRPPDEIYSETEIPDSVSASRWWGSLAPPASPSCWRWWPAIARMVIALLTSGHIIEILLQPSKMLSEHFRQKVIRDTPWLKSPWH